VVLGQLLQFANLSRKGSPHRILHTSSCLLVHLLLSWKPAPDTLSGGFCSLRELPLPDSAPACDEAQE